jgi:type VI secretion system protein ImpB
MKHTIQQDIARARINLTVDVQTQVGTKSIVLPHKVLVIGDFSAGKSADLLQNRPRHRITRETRDAILAHYAPELHLSLDNKIKEDCDKLQINLQFRSLHDFHPESIVSRVPDLKQLLAMRHLLKDLRSQIVDKPDFRSILYALVSDEVKMLALNSELSSKLLTLEE